MDPISIERKRKSDEIQASPCDKPGVMAKRGKAMLPALDLDAPTEPSYDPPGPGLTTLVGDNDLSGMPSPVMNTILHRRVRNPTTLVNDDDLSGRSAPVNNSSSLRRSHNQPAPNAPAPNAPVSNAPAPNAPVTSL